MINLMALRPSQWDRLEEELASRSTQEEFLDGLESYLQSTSADGGVDTDRIYVTAVKTENAGAWQYINSDRLLAILKRVDTQVSKIFLSGVSSALEADLLQRLDARDPEDAVAVVEEDVAEPALLSQAVAATPTLEDIVKQLAGDSTAVRKVAAAVKLPSKSKGRHGKRFKPKSPAEWNSPVLTYHRVEKRSAIGGGVVSAAQKRAALARIVDGPQAALPKSVTLISRHRRSRSHAANIENIKGVVTIIDGNDIYVVRDE